MNRAKLFSTLICLGLLWSGVAVARSHPWLLQSADALAGEIGAVGDESELGLALRQARSLLTAVA